MENKEENLLINDTNSTELGINKKRFPWKYVIIISGISILIIIIIILVIFLLNKSSPNNTDYDKPEDRLEIGNIYCKYDIDSENTETKIFGDEFNKTSEFEIYINGNKIKYSKIYKFNSFGLNDIEIKLYDNLDMNYMFKGISSLI